MVGVLIGTQTQNNPVSSKWLLVTLKILLGSLKCHLKGLKRERYLIEERNKEKTDEVSRYNIKVKLRFSSAARSRLLLLLLVDVIESKTYMNFSPPFIY